MRVVEIVCGGLQGGDGGGFFFCLHHALDELGDGAFAFGDLGDFGARGQLVRNRISHQLTHTTSRYK
jgi:hypothetical protein